MVTAYCLCVLCCGQWADQDSADRRTAYQQQPRPGRTLACPATWRGLVLWLDGLGVGVCEDRGPDHSIDVLVADHAEAVRFGRRRAAVTVVR
jgi:hypothetical protein